MTPEQHDAHHSVCYAQQVELEDYVRCGLCTFIGTRIMGHVKKHHQLSRVEYETMWGQASSNSTKERYSEHHKRCGSWITKAKAAGEDLSEWKQKMGAGVRKSIMSNPAERERRSKLASSTIGAIAQTAEGRKRSSDAAKITSARPEIQEARAGKLRAWRKRCPDEFRDKCIDAMHKLQTTKPERALLAFLQAEFPTFEFKGNQQLMAPCFVLNRTTRRQLDVLSKSRRIIVEFDGPLHFKNIEKWDQLALVQAKDKELDEGATSLGYIVIRVGADQAAGSSGELTVECKEQLRRIIAGARPGNLYKIGQVYE